MTQNSCLPTCSCLHLQHKKWLLIPKQLSFKCMLHQNNWILNLTSTLTIILLVCCSEYFPWMNRSGWETAKRGSFSNGLSPVAAWLTASLFPGGCNLHSFPGREEEALVSMRLIHACFCPVSCDWFGLWVSLNCSGRVADLSGTVVNWLWALVLSPSPFSLNERTNVAPVVCPTGEADRATWEETVLASSFFLDSSWEVWLIGTLVVATVLGCVRTDTGVRPSVLEWSRSFPPSQGEDWLVGMAPTNKELSYFWGNCFRARFLLGWMWRRGNNKGGYNHWCDLLLPDANLAAPFFQKKRDVSSNWMELSIFCRSLQIVYKFLIYPDQQQS